MPLVCSCDVITHAEYREKAQKLGPQISAAKSFGSAVGIVFKATHPERQSEPVEIIEKTRCQGCTPHIGRAIIEEGLRPAAEFETWNERQKRANSKCQNCPNSGACKVSFDI